MLVFERRMPFLNVAGSNFVRILQELLKRRIPESVT